MSDLETMKKMLSKASIEFSEETELKGPVLTVERGYVGFVTVFQFDANGTLLDMGAYE